MTRVSDISELTDDARRALLAHAPLGRHRSAWISGYIRALIWADCREAFTDWRGPT